MKKILLFFTFFLLLTNLTAITISEAQNEFESQLHIEICSLELIEKNESNSIYKIIDENGITWWGVVAQIATALLPIRETWNYGCTRLTGNPDACNIVFEAIDDLLTIRSLGKYLTRTGNFITSSRRNWKWESTYHKINSSTKAVVDSYLAAQDVSKVLNSFSNISEYCSNIEWNSVSISEFESNNLTAYISGDDVRIRKGGGLGFSIIDKLYSGHPVIVIKYGTYETINGNAGYWTKIIYDNNKEGWVFGYYLKQ